MHGPQVTRCAPTARVLALLTLTWALVGWPAGTASADACAYASTGPDGTVAVARAGGPHPPGDPHRPHPPGGPHRPHPPGGHRWPDPPCPKPPPPCPPEPTPTPTPPHGAGSGGRGEPHMRLF
ncbi:hypothetical protein OZK63_12400, partial [Streptomyces sp. UMAF16]|nr:hypothetical protein [Streptomyces sp. UMAF16]